MAPHVLVIACVPERDLAEPKASNSIRLAAATINAVVINRFPTALKRIIEAKGAKVPDLDNPGVGGGSRCLSSCTRIATVPSPRERPNGRVLTRSDVLPCLVALREATRARGGRCEVVRYTSKKASGYEKTDPLYDK